MSAWLYAALAAGWAVALVQGFAIAALLMTVGQIYLRREGVAKVLITDEGPEIAEPFPGFDGRTLEGAPLSSRAWDGQEYVLLFASAHCEACEVVLSQLERARRRLAVPLPIAVVFEGSESEAREARKRFKVRAPMIRDEGGALRLGLRIDRTPYGVLVDRTGAVAMKGVVDSGLRLEGLVHRRGISDRGMSWIEERPLLVPSAGSGG